MSIKYLLSRLENSGLRISLHFCVQVVFCILMAMSAAGTVHRVISILHKFMCLVSCTWTFFYLNSTTIFNFSFFRVDEVDMIFYDQGSELIFCLEPCGVTIIFRSLPQHASSFPLARLHSQSLVSSLEHSLAGLCS